MSLPQLLAKEEANEQVRKDLKTKLEENPNFKVIKQISYEEEPGFIPSFKRHSFIVYEDKTDKKIKVAKATNKDIEFLSMEALKNFNTSKLTEKSKEDYTTLCTYVTHLNFVAQNKNVLTKGKSLSEDDSSHSPNKSKPK
jgi:chromatin segregation and condensation protein Rec8/ScpA/Scc1 (kleisin family)